MFAIRFGEHAVAEIARLRAVERRGILNAVEKYLAHKPTEATGRKKMLRGLVPPWAQVRPVWPLTVVPFRVFYDVDEDAREVMINAVRRKPTGRRTEDIL